jgi:hypothetical protein
MAYSDGTMVLDSSLVAYILVKSSLPREATINDDFDRYKVTCAEITKISPPPPHQTSQVQACT